RLEHTLSKSEILELYLNSIFLGRASSGVEMAARSYFGKPARDLTLSEGALLAGITKGPNYFSPIRNVERARERFRYVLGRMQEGLASYEKNARRVEFQGPELNLSAAIERATAEPDSSASPNWLRALKSARLPRDIQWKAAVVIETGGAKRSQTIRVGLSDGRTLPLSGAASILRRPKLHD